MAKKIISDVSTLKHTGGGKSPKTEDVLTMGFDKSYPNRKDWRKPYQKGSAQACSGSCRPGGSCPYCKDNRMHSTKKRELSAKDKMNETFAQQVLRAMREAALEDGALPDRGTMPVPFRVKEIHVSLTPEEERAVTYARQHNHEAPVQIISLDTLCATQHTVETERVNAFIQKSDLTPRFPVVAQYQGELIIADGHHRLTALKLQGQQTAKAHVVTVDDQRIAEDVAANAAGLGGVTGIGVGPKGEPGYRIRKKNLQDIIGEAAKMYDHRIQGIALGPNDKVLGYKIFNFPSKDQYPGISYTTRMKNTAEAELRRKYPSAVRIATTLNQDEFFESAQRVTEAAPTHLEKVKCSRCDGSGTDYDETCETCGGYGYRYWDEKKREWVYASDLDEEVKPDDQFAGADVFEVDTGAFMKSRFGKNRYHRYSKYVGEDEKGETIRQHGRSTKRDIMLKDSRTGAMIYLRRKRPIG